jgi:hypothetical protein
MPILNESPKLKRVIAKPMFAAIHRMIPNQPGMMLSQKGRNISSGIGNPMALAAVE